MPLGVCLNLSMSMPEVSSGADDQQDTGPVPSISLGAWADVREAPVMVDPECRQFIVVLVESLHLRMRTPRLVKAGGA